MTDIAAAVKNGLAASPVDGNWWLSFLASVDDMFALAIGLAGVNAVQGIVDLPESFGVTSGFSGVLGASGALGDASFESLSFSIS